MQPEMMACTIVADASLVRRTLYRISYTVQVEGQKWLQCGTVEYSEEQLSVFLSD